jgi:hypothetical protein
VEEMASPHSLDEFFFGLEHEDVNDWCEILKRTWMPTKISRLLIKFDLKGKAKD